MIESVRDLLRTRDDGTLVGQFGRYESLTPFEVWLCEQVADDMADETSGSTEWGEWFARIGSRIVSTDDRGFWYVSRYANEAEAMAVFAKADAAYGEWLADEEEEVAEDGPMVGALVTVAGYRGVAFRVDTDNWQGTLTGHMVGDDHTHTFDVADTTAVDADDVCDCGSIGCFSPNNLAE